MNDPARAAAAAADFELVVTSGPSVGVTIPLTRSSLAFGTAATNDIHMKDASVRPFHAQLDIGEDGALWFHDLSGAGETFVNGRPITSCQLEPDARIRIGAVELWLRKRGSTPGASRSQPIAAAEPGAEPEDQIGIEPTLMRPYPAPPPSGKTRKPPTVVPASSGKPKSGPSDTFLRPSGAQPKAAPSGARSGVKPPTGPNETYLRPVSGLSLPASGRSSRAFAAPADPEAHVEAGIEDTGPTGSMLRLDEVIADRYRIVGKLAAGGMGEVYKAEHVELGKLFALKVMRREMGNDAEFAERFKREAITASRIGQQNIVDISDFGRTEAGLFYFVMEFLIGETLADLSKREGALSTQRAVPISLQICHALSAAHSQGIIHRDLKPENVMLLQRPGQPDFVKVLDFGVAKVAEGHGMGGQTALGIVLGTPQYMSPEQASGLPVDTRSDIYSLGLMIYEMVSGRPVFQEATPSLLMVAHINRPPPPMLPGPISLPLPDGLESLVMRMLSKAPKDRPASMDEVAAVLETCLSARGPRSSGDWPPPAVAPAAPVPTAPAAGSPPAAAEPSASGGSKRWILIAGLLLLAGAGAGVGIAVTRPGATADAPVSAPPPVVPEKPTPVVVKLAEGLKPSELVKLTLTSTPPGASVNEGDALIGRTPLEFTWEKGKKGAFVFQLPGYASETKTLAPQVDLMLEVALKKNSAGPSGKKPPRTRKGPELLDNPYGNQVQDLQEDPY